MSRYLFIISFLLLSKASCGQSEWELKRDRSGVVIYTKESSDNHLKEYRVSALIEGSLKNVYAFLTDLEYRPEWINNCTGIEIIDTLKDGRIRYHTGYDIPWPLQDRDLVVEAMFSMQEGAASAHLLTCQTELEYPPIKGVIRMPRYREEVFLERIDAGTTRYRSEGFADTGGTMPPWVVNVFLVDNIYDSVIETRKSIAERTKTGVPEQE